MQGKGGGDVRCFSDMAAKGGGCVCKDREGPIDVKGEVTNGEVCDFQFSICDWKRSAPWTKAILGN